MVDLGTRFGSNAGSKSMPKKVRQQCQNVINEIKTETQYDIKSMPKQVAKKIMKIIKIMFPDM